MDDIRRDSLCAIGWALESGLDSLFQEYSFPAKCIGHPARSAIVVDSVYVDGNEKLGELLARVVDEHDILLHRPNFVTLVHNLDHVSQTLSAVEIVLKSMQWQ